MILKEFINEKSWHAGCNVLINVAFRAPQPDHRTRVGRNSRMNRQSAAQFRFSSLHIQQGLWAALALLVTLVIGQQWMLWQERQQPEAPQTLIHRAPQTHFSAVSSVAEASASMRMMDVDQAQPMVDMPREERWVF
ncbi:hypothetical protein J2W59_003011 [Pseudomonas fluorescens]|nr:hypothetical protein [Pseudomonas fluorescens]